MFMPDTFVTAHPSYFFFLFKEFILDCAESSLLHGLFSSCGDWGLLVITVLGLLTAVASRVVDTGSGCTGSVAAAPWLWRTSSIAVECRARSSNTCGISPGQGSNPCLLHWQADSLPLGYQGSPILSLKSASQKIMEQPESRNWFFQFSLEDSQV